MPPADGEKLTGVTDGRGVRAVSSTQRAEDSSESHEEEQMVSSDQERLCTRGHSPLWDGLYVSVSIPAWIPCLDRDDRSACVVCLLSMHPICLGKLAEGVCGEYLGDVQKGDHEVLLCCVSLDGLCSSGTSCL